MVRCFQKWKCSFFIKAEAGIFKYENTFLYQGCLGVSQNVFEEMIVLCPVRRDIHFLLFVLKFVSKVKSACKAPKVRGPAGGGLGLKSNQSGHIRPPAEARSLQFPTNLQPFCMFATKKG